MRQEYSETLLKPATLYIAFDDEAADVAVADHRDKVADHRNNVRRSVSRAALHLAYVNPDAVAMTPKNDSDRQTMWSKMLNFIVEGFAVSEVSLPPMEDFLAEDGWPEEKQEIDSTSGQRVIAMFPVPSPMGSPHWNWWASSREVATAIGAHLRKERDIKRAIAALSELDDETLRDIGIPQRSRIEYVVRYCHEC